FYGTSIRQIAAPVEINPATLYAHYPSKEHILAELVLIGHQELYTRLEEALAKAGADPASRLAALIREHSLVHAQYPLLAVVANTELHALSGPRAAAPLALRARCRALLIAVLDEGGRSGAFSMADPALTGIALGGLGMQVAHWFGPEQPYSREQVADAYAVLALRMVGARSDLGEKGASWKCRPRPMTWMWRGARCGSFPGAPARGPRQRSTGAQATRSACRRGPRRFRKDGSCRASA